MNFKYENKKINEGHSFVIGCDEVGRGCLAGPVVAGAVVLPDKLKVESYKVIKSANIRDSKLLSPEQRVKSADVIREHAVWGIGVVDEKTIDEINIHNASLLAMKRAVEQLLGVIPTRFAREARRADECSRGVEESVNQLENRSLHSPSDAFRLGRDGIARCFLAIDGKFPIPNLDITQEPIIDGDNKILSIAAASIIAKVYRDDLMRQLHQHYPIYNFAQHKGYATLFHRTIILQNGLSPIHRRTFCENLTV